jgi:anti-sigma factor RsiW
MIDCMNAEIRDRLPDLLHERLDSETRAAVVAHVAGCEACRQELAVLRATKGLFARVPRVDATRIAGVVVAQSKSGTPAATGRVPSMGRWWVSWRMAAAIVLVALGGAAIVTVYSMRQQARDASERIAERTLDSGAVVVPSPVKAPDATRPVPQGPSAVATQPPKASTPPERPTGVVASNQAVELSVAESESELSEGELRALLSELERVELLPAIEPEPVAVRIAPRLTLGGGRGSSE